MANTVISPANVVRTVVFDPSQANLRRKSAISPVLQLFLDFFLEEQLNVFSGPILVFTFSSVNCSSIMPKVKFLAHSWKS